MGTATATTAPTFLPTAITTADAPAVCPAWCAGHSAQYASDFGPFDSSKDYQEQRATFRTHAKSYGDVFTANGTEWILWVRQPEGEAVRVEFTVGRCLMLLTPPETTDELVTALQTVVGELQR